jgi:hypothetical protein
MCRSENVSDATSASTLRHKLNTDVAVVHPICGGDDNKQNAGHDDTVRTEKAHLATDSCTME